MRQRMNPDLRANQRGDTIVAILLSIAIIGSVIALAYFLINRSFALNLRARQRNQVIKLVQGQVEGLKSLTILGGKDSTPPPGTPGDIFNYDDYRGTKRIRTASEEFCLSVDNKLIPLTTALPSGTPPGTRVTPDRRGECGGLDDIAGLESAEVDLSITYTADPDCPLANASPPTATTPQTCSLSDARNEDLFKVRAEWQAYGSGADQGCGRAGIDCLEVLIRLHPIQPPTP